MTGSSPPANGSHSVRRSITTGSPSSASASGRLRVNLCRHRCARSPRSFSELRARTHTSGALSGSCPVVASYGRRDLVYGRHAHRLVNELTEHDIDHDVKVYGEAGHSFLTRGHHPLGRLVFLPLRLGYHEDSAADAWDRIFWFFDRHVQAGTQDENTEPESP
ncbi:dienelactone hydrolase family protein [Saccharomonospora azurea]|uniref:dienelactone hydrolase family protein n=1 Tax=Saccharomonospora azurea TaxID=40988 RepID=UPI0038CD1770